MSEDSEADILEFLCESSSLSNVASFQICALLIETHSPALEQECVAILRREGFATRIVPTAWWRGVLPEQRGLEQNRWLVAAKPGDMDLR
jgi:hypothetical protein